MTKSEIVEALRCAASECFRLDETGSYRLYGSSVSRASSHFDCSVTELQLAARRVGVEIIVAGLGIDAKVAAILEAAQRIEDGD